MKYILKKHANIEVWAEDVLEKYIFWENKVFLESLK
jgi:hypothetical protein